MFFTITYTYLALLSVLDQYAKVNNANNFTITFPQDSLIPSNLQANPIT